MHIATPKGEPEMAPCHTANTTPPARTAKEVASLRQGYILSMAAFRPQDIIGKSALIICAKERLTWTKLAFPKATDNAKEIPIAKNRGHCEAKSWRWYDHDCSEADNS